MKNQTNLDHIWPRFIDMVSVETSASTMERPLREVRNGFMVATSQTFSNGGKDVSFNRLALWCEE